MQELEMVRLYGARLLPLCERVLTTLRGRSKGQSTVEYALIGALIVVMASAAVATLGTSITGVFGALNNALQP